MQPHLLAPSPTIRHNCIRARNIFFTRLKKKKKKKGTTWIADKPPTCKKREILTVSFFLFLRRKLYHWYYFKTLISFTMQSKRLGGTDSIQTNKGKEILALWVKTWAKVLPRRRTWKKEKFCSIKQRVFDYMHKDGCSILLLLYKRSHFKMTDFEICGVVDIKYNTIQAHKSWEWWI